MDQYRHHAFISYAWVDDQPFDADGNRADRSAPAGQRGWVSTFHDRLRKHLGRALGRTAEGERIWIDYEALRGTDGVQPTIVRELNASALLIPIVSRSWFASRWCREEFDAFCRGHDQPGQRLCPVWMEPVERDDLSTDAERAIWERLRGPDAPLGYPFWYRDQARQPRTLWFPHMDPTDRRYGDTQQNMARDMADRLRALARQATEPRDRDQGAPAPPEAEPVPPPEPIPGGHFVLINGGSHDAPLVQAVADTLARRHGVGYVIPLMAQQGLSGLKPSDLRRDLRDNLKLATCVLMVYSEGPVEQVHEQLRACVQAAARHPESAPALDLCHTGNLPLTFRPPGIRVHRVGADCTDDCVRCFAAELLAAAGS
jgi:hypothetical protein